MALPKKNVTIEVTGTFEKTQEVIFSKDMLIKGVVRMTMTWEKARSIGTGLKKKISGPVDLDVSAFICNKDYECESPQDLNFYAHMECYDGAVKHSPDARDGGSEEWIEIDFPKLPAGKDVIVIVANNYNGEQHLGMVEEALFSVAYGNGGKLECQISGNAELEGHKAAAFVIFERVAEDSWSMKVEPTIVEVNDKPVENLEMLCAYFGLNPADVKSAFPGC